MKKTAAKTAAKPASPEKKVAAVKKSVPSKPEKAPKKAAAPVAPAAAVAKTAKPAKISAKPLPKAKAKPASVVTTIVAAVDVGFGNALTLRGEGPGLSWDVGVPLECVADDRWSITLPETSLPIVCKFLRNDADWCEGEDYTVLPGSSVVLSPTF